MTSTNDGKDVKSNQTSGTKGKSFYIELYKSLEAGLSKDSDLSERTQNLCDAWRRVHSLCAHSAASTHPHLVSWLQRHTARTVLQTEWQDPENKNEHKRLEEAIDDFIKDSQSSKDGDPPWQTQLVARGEWFKRILENPWGHPVLRVLLDPKRKESPKDEEVLEWLKEERGVMFVTRLRQLASSKHCKDLALELASGILDRVRACMDPPKDDQVDETKEKPKNDGQPTFMDILKAEAGFTIDVMELLTDIEFVLLHKRDNVARCIELAKQTPLRNGYQLVERLQSRQETSPREKKLWKNAKDVATLIAQVVIARCMVVSVCAGVSRTALYCCARSLARLLGAARLAPAAAALAAPAATARHLHTLALAVDSESKDDMKPFVCELYVRAITTGMNELERLKLNADKASEARSSEQTLSQWFVQLGTVLAASERMRCECTLTAFSVHPSPAMYDKIKAAPALAPVSMDIEPKEEHTASEFGSWACDSRGQTNFVKTSETLKLKQTQHQANVLSTAILTEGETLQLSPELCQDIAVLLSGPRVKTLSWDMDRQLLLENCRTYMERTHFGTRALTTELKYLNLDLRQYQHLPEEDEDDNDMYYGIEKGYEHLVEFQEPEEIWEDADDAERTESAYSTDIEIDVVKTKSRSKKIFKSSEDEDPLSTVAEAKRITKKKERPHSKERSKVSKLKTKTKSKDPLEIDNPTAEQNITIDHSTERTTDHSIEGQREHSVEKKKVTKPRVQKKKDHSTERKKDTKKRDQSTEKKKDTKKRDQSTEKKKDTKKRDQSTEKKKEPKDKDNKKEKKVRKRKEKTVNHEHKPSSLSSLIGMKVTNLDDKNELAKPTVMPNNSYDNQGQAINNSLLSEGNETDVLFDGLFCMDELKSPEKTADNKNMAFMRNSEAYVPKAAVTPTPDPKISDTERCDTPTLRRISLENSQSKVIVNEEVKRSITKLIEFRRQKAMSGSPELRNPMVHPNLQTYSNKNIKPQDPQPQVGDSKVFLKKSQSEQLAVLRNEVNNLKEYMSRPSQQYSPSPKLNNIPSGIKILNSTVDNSAIHRPSTSKDGFTASPNTHERLNRQTSSTSQDRVTQKPVGGHQKNFHDFLKDLQASINAGAGNKVRCVAQSEKEIKPISKVNPVCPKSEPKVTQSAKQPVKKSELAPNTFSRLSYYKTNKNCVKTTKQFVEAVVEHQSQQLDKMKSGDLDRIIAKQKLAKINYLNSSGETVIKPSKSTDNTQKVVKNVSIKSQDKVLISLLQSGTNCTKTSVTQNSQVDKHKPRDRTTSLQNNPSSLTEKDQQDLVNLIRQQSKQNKPKLETSKAQPSQPNLSNICKVSNLQKMKGIDYKSVIQNNPGLKPSSDKSMAKLSAVKTEQPHIKHFEQTVIHKNKLNDSGGKNILASGNTKHQEIVAPQKLKVNDIGGKSVPKKVNTTREQEMTKQTDWESVMDALLKHKTPSRGPNALDMALNNDSYLSAYENSLRNPSLLQSPEPSSASDVVQAQPLFGADTQHSVSNPNILKQSNIDIKHTKSKSNKSSRSQKVVTNPVLETQTSSASIQGVRLDHSKAEKSKKLVNDCRQKDATKKLNAELKKQQFTCPLPTEDDPFISGNLNSDYDLLEELIDDDLRQEIGELLSDDDCYAPPNQALKDPKTFINVNRAITPVIHEIKRCVAPPLANTNVTQPNLKIPMQKLPCQNLSTPAFNTTLPAQQPTGYVSKNNTAQNIPDIQTANMIHQVPKSVIIQPKIEQNYVQAVPTIDQAFVTVPQQTALQNVVLIGSELVYQPCVQTPIHTGIPQATYVTFNTQPNIAVYQTTQFAAPVVNPLIIGNAITSPTVPVDVSAIQANPPVIQEPVKNEIKISDASEQADAKEDNKRSVDYPTQDDSATKEKSDDNKRSVDSPTQDGSATKEKSYNNKRSVDYPSQDDSATKEKSDNIKRSVDYPTQDDSATKEKSDDNKRSVDSPTQDDSATKEKSDSNKISVDYPTLDDSATKEKSDVNSSKSCERKVLSEVQEKQKLDFTEKLDSKTIKTQRLSFEHEGKKTVDHDRLYKKRMAILNRNIYHRSDTPIPLTYTPLKSKKSEVTKTQEKHHNLRNAVKPPVRYNERNTKSDSVINAKTKEKHHNLKNAVKAADRDNEINVEPKCVINAKIMTSIEPEPIKVNEKDGNENCKENTNKSCRRILLRSTNKLDSETIEKSSSVKTETKKTKVRLKVTSETENLIESGSEVKHSNVKKRAPKKTINKTIKKTVIKKRITRQTTKNAVATLNSANKNTSKEQRKTVVVDEEKYGKDDISDLMDIEDQIVGSMILKKTLCESVIVDGPDTLHVNDNAVEMNTNVPNNDISGESNYILSNEVKISTFENNTPKNNSNKSAEIPNELTDLKNDASEAHSDHQNSNSEECIDSQGSKKEDCSDSQFNKGDKLTNSQSNELCDKESVLKSMEHSTEPEKEVNEPKDSTLDTPTDLGIVCSKNNLDNTGTKTKTTPTAIKSKVDSEVICLDDDTIAEKPKTDTWKQFEFGDKIPQAFLDSIKIEEIETPDPKDPLKRCVRIKLPNGRAFKATVRGQTHVNIENLFSDPALKKVLLSNISSRNRYTLNIKQISASNKIQPDKILETRIQNISLQIPKPLPRVEPINCMETINLLSDDEEDSFEYFNTEFGKYKVPTMKRKLLETHQKIFDKKCIVKLKKVSLQQSVVTSSILDAVKEPESETICVDEKTPISVPAGVTITKTVQHITQGKSSTNDEPPTPEVIELDDSSNDESNLNDNVLPEKNKEAKTCEEKILEFKNLLLKDLGVDEIDDNLSNLCTPMVGVHKLLPMEEKSEELIIPDILTKFDDESSEELIVPDTLTTEFPICNPFKSDETISQTSPTSVCAVVDVVDKNCFVKLTNCDDLVEQYNNLKLIKECCIKLVRCDDIEDNTIYNDSDNDITSHPLSRCGSFSILNDFDLLDQPSLSDDFSRCTSPVMNAYDSFAAIRNWKTDDQFNMYKQWRCETEWFLTKSLIWLQNKMAWNDHQDHRISNTCKPNTVLSMDNNTASKVLSLRQMNVPNLVAILTKYFQKNNVLEKYNYVYTPMSYMNSSYNLKRKSLSNIPKSSRKPKKNKRSIHTQSYVSAEDGQKVFVEMPSELLSTIEENKNISDLVRHKFSSDLMKAELTDSGSSIHGNDIQELKNKLPIVEDLEHCIEQENIGHIDTNKESHPEKSESSSVQQQHKENINPEEKQFTAGETLQLKTVELMNITLHENLITNVEVTENQPNDYKKPINSDIKISVADKYLNSVSKNVSNMDFDLDDTEEHKSNAFSKSINTTAALIPQHNEDTVTCTVDLITNAENSEQPSNCDKIQHTKTIKSDNVPECTKFIFVGTSNYDVQNQSKQKIEVKDQHQTCLKDDISKDDSVVRNLLIAHEVESSETLVETSNSQLVHIETDENVSQDTELIVNSEPAEEISKYLQKTDNILRNISSKLEEIFDSKDQSVNSCNISEVTENQNKIVTIIDHSYTLNDDVTNIECENSVRKVTESPVYDSCKGIQADTINIVSDEELSQDTVEDVVDMRSDEMIEEELAHIVLGYPVRPDNHADNTELTKKILKSDSHIKNVDSPLLNDTGSNLVTLNEKCTQTNLKHDNLADDGHQPSNKPLCKSLNEANVKTNAAICDEKLDQELAQIVLGCKNSKGIRNDLFDILDDGAEIKATDDKITEHESNKLESLNLTSDSTFNKSNYKIVDDIVELDSNDELERELARIVLGNTDGEDDDKQILIIDADNLEFDEVKVCCIQQSELQRLMKINNNVKSDQNITDYGNTEPSDSFLDDDDFCQSSEDILQITQEIDEYGNVKEIDIRLNVPKVTYSRKVENDSFDRQSLYGDKKNRKRKGDMADVKTPERKYRKGKNIDTPKLTAATIADTAYSKEFKRLFEYCSSIKFSYSLPFHKEHIDVDEVLKSWPIAEVTDVFTDFSIDENLFIDVENENAAQRDPLNQTLAEELASEHSEKDYPSCHVMETNFLMGFGERSGRVIQNSEDGGGIFSAATLSDVKQTQPLLLSENYNCKNVQDANNIKMVKCEIEKLQYNYKCIQLKNKIRSFFKETMVELNNDWIKLNKKYDDIYSHGYSKASKSYFPFGLNLPDFIKPPPAEVVVQVVQVGQLPVSAAAQNPVTCDPRVTQVSNASPSQCTAENSPNDDPQSAIKTEYTELTTADINLPLHGYAQHHSQLLAESQNSSIMHHGYIIEDIKEEIKEEIEEEPEISDDANNHFDTGIPNHQFSPGENCIMDNINYSYEGAVPPHPAPTLVEGNIEMIYNSTKTYQKAETHLQQYHQTQLQNKNQAKIQNQLVEITQHDSDISTHAMQQSSPVQQEQQPLVAQQIPQAQTDHHSPQLQHSQEKLSQQNQKEHIEQHNFTEQLPQQNQQAQINQQNLQTQVAQQNLQTHTGQQNHIVQSNNSQANIIQQNNQQVHIAQQNQQGQLAQQSQKVQQEQQVQDAPQTHVVQVQLSQTQLGQQNHQDQNSSQEKTDQIAHAMNAAGITTSPESLANTRAHALVNILSHKLRQGSVGGSPTNSYPKTAQINAMALQQALAQILPPPLNQTNVTENNQPNSASTPQVLHIVQGKNASGNQITLVDNSQPSVINAPNATPVLHIVQNKGNASGPTTNGTPAPQTNSFSGLSLVDAGLQQGNQLLHIVNAGNQKNANAGQLLRKVNLLTNIANVQGSNEQKMVQFVCKSADGKSIQLNSPHPRGMVLRLQPVESPNLQVTQVKPNDSQELSPASGTTNNVQNKEAGASQQEIKSRSVYEENYAKFIQSSNKTTIPEKATSLPKFGQAFGKQVFQEGTQKTDINNSNSHLQSSSENPDCQPNDNAISLDHISQISSPPLLLRKSPQTSQAQPNLVHQLKQTMAPVNMSMHGGVIYTRQIPVNIGGGQTINLITVPSTELIDESASKHQGVTQEGIEPSIIKIVPQAPASSSETSDENNSHIGNDNNHTAQSQPVLTQMRIKLPMLSKNPQMVGGTRLVRPSFFQIQRNVIGGANQPVYQQLVLTAAPPLGQQTIRLPQTQTQPNRHVKVPSESQSSESQMSSSTLEQLREFDLVLEQVKERSTGTGTAQPSATPSSSSSFTKLHTSSAKDTTDSSPTPSATSTATESTQQVLYSIGNTQQVNVAYVNRKAPATTTTTSSFVRSPDSSGIVESPTSSTHQVRRTASSDSSAADTPTTSNHSSQASHTSHTTQQSKPAKVKPKPRPKAASNPPNTLKLPTAPPKTSTQKPAEDEQTTQRILYILAEYKEQVENSPDKDKPAPRRRTHPPSNPGGSSKRKKSSSGSRRSGRDMSPCHGEDTCRTMGSEDSSCGTSQGDCNESCVDSHSPQDSPRKVVRKLTFEQETVIPATQPRPQPPRNVIVADGQTITVARGTAGKPTTAVLMPANYILPVSMVKGGQQIAIVTNRGPKLLTVGGGEGGATNALLLQRLIGPAGLKPMLARPGVRHVRLPTAALQNLHTFNLATATTVQPPDSTASPAPAPTPPDLVDTRATSSTWRIERDSRNTKPDRASSPEGSEPWHLQPSDYCYEETVRGENMDRTVLDPIPDRYSPDMEAQRIFDKMFDVDSKKSYMVDSHDDSPRCGYDIDASDCDDKAYHQVVHKKEGSSHRQHRLTHVSAAALRHKYAILEHELRLQKSLSEECEDLGVDSPSASDLFPEAELLFAASPAPEHTHDQPHHSHTPQPMLSQSGIPQPDMDDQIATDQLLPRSDIHDDRDLGLGLEDVGIVTVSEDGMQATIQVDQEEFARSHPNTTFHTDEGEVHQSFTLSSLKGRHITSTILHSHRPQGTVLMTAPQTTVISQATPETSGAHHSAIKYTDIDNMINSIPGTHYGQSSVLVKDDGLSRFDNLLNDSRQIHLSNTTSAIVHSSAHTTQVIRRVCYEDDKRDRDHRFIMDDDAKMMGEDSSRDATLESMGGDTTGSSPERHTELFWDSHSASGRADFSSDSEKCCKSPSDDTSTDSSAGVGIRAHMRLDSVIKEARGHASDEDAPPLRTYPAPRSLGGKTAPSAAAERGRRRASGRALVKRGGCLCCVGDAPPRPKKPRARRPALDFAAAN